MNDFLNFMLAVALSSRTFIYYYDEAVLYKALVSYGSTSQSFFFTHHCEKKNLDQIIYQKRRGIALDHNIYK
jgi:hypothetical protein